MTRLVWYRDVEKTYWPGEDRPHISVGAAMRVSKRSQDVSIAQTQLQIKISEYQLAKDVEDVELFRLLSLEFRSILLDMEPAIKRAEHFSDLKDLIKAHQAEHKLTDIEVLQAISSHFSSVLKYMLRYERNGNYDTPAAEE